jgi:DAACS family dicarboxylate/amino acid:cation (Na+ or H+) symporter
MRAILTLAAAVIGGALGLLANWLLEGSAFLAGVLEYGAVPIGQVFLRLLSMLVVPLVFSALVMGIAELDLGQLLKMGLRMIGYTIVVSAIAVLIGLTLINTIRPGVGHDDIREAAASAEAPPLPDKTWVQLLVEMIPDNPVKAAAEGQMLAVIVFALLFGVALALTKTDAAETLKKMIAGLYDVMMKMIGGVLWVMPLGVLALVFSMTARLGVDVLIQLAGFVGVVMLGLGIHLVVVYSISVRVFGGMSPIKFFTGIWDALITAFSTASSNATLPTALRVADENLKLDKQVSRFVLTAGSAMNQNGTALFEGVTVLFLAQLYGVPLDFGDQIIVILICILGGIGTAGVPAGSIPVIALILAMYQIPAEGLGLILGINHPLDMSRTVLNVTGDLAAAVYVNKHAKKPEVTPEEPPYR